MLNIRDLWIGERLRLKSGGKTGTYEGPGSGSMVIIRTEDKLLLVGIEELELAPEEDASAAIPLWDDEPTRKKTANFSKVPSVIDLHIESLAPELIHARPELILRKQQKAFQEFMEKAIDSGLPHLTIIHGKGEGVLRDEVRFKLSKVFHAKIIIPAADDGSTEAWMF